MGMNLLSVQGYGFLYTLFLLLLCIIVVHAVKLARVGWRTLKKRTPPQKKEAPKSEPVYFLVERKKKRTRSEYSEPKQIKFK